MSGTYIYIFIYYKQRKTDPDGVYKSIYNNTWRDETWSIIGLSSDALLVAGFL